MSHHPRQPGRSDCRDQGKSVRKASVHVVVVLLCMLLLATGARGQQAVGEGGSSDVQTRLVEAIREDLTYGRGEGRTQARAIAAWQKFLDGGEPTIEQEIFAHWRIASMYGYNFDRARGEDRDYAKAEQHLAKVLSLKPDVVSRETTNAITLFAGLPGTPMQRAQRKVEMYRRLNSFTDEQINASAELTFERGLLVPLLSLQRGAETARPTLAERREMVKSRVERAVRRVAQAG
jgi:hypothetical protein